MRKENFIKSILPAMVLVVFASSFCLGSYLMFGNVLVLNSSKHAARSEICRAVDFVVKGDSYSEAVSRISENKWQFIYKVGENAEVAVFSAPVEFPGLTTQWRMFVIGKNGVVDRVDLKTVDGNDVHCEPRAGASNQAAMRPLKWSLISA